MERVIVMASLVSIPASTIFSMPALSAFDHVSGRSLGTSSLKAAVVKKILKYMIITIIFIVSSAGLPVGVTNGNKKGYRSRKVDAILLSKIIPFFKPAVGKVGRSVNKIKVSKFRLMRHAYFPQSHGIFLSIMDLIMIVRGCELNINRTR